MSKQQRDIYQEVTDTIVASLEKAGQWERPWSNLTNDTFNPRSIDGRPYRGGNVLLLWVAAEIGGYETGIWGTYKAWASKGAQVRKGEKGTLVTLWKPIERTARDGEKTNKNGKADTLLLRSYFVFNAAQVDGWEPEAVDTSNAPTPIEAAEAFFGAIDSDVSYQGNLAYYTPALDKIVVPKLEAFKAAESFYATLAHEHGHWTGHESRLARDFKNRFGTEAYAFEELVAELTAAFVGAHLGIGSEIREDHASYLKNWLKVLKADKKAIFTAASQAQKAADFLIAAAEGESSDSPEAELVSA